MMYPTTPCATTFVDFKTTHIHSTDPPAVRIAQKMGIKKLNLSRLASAHDDDATLTSQWTTCCTPWTKLRGDWNITKQPAKSSNFEAARGSLGWPSFTVKQFTINSYLNN